MGGNYNHILPLSYEQNSANQRRRRQEEECCNKIKLYICWTIVFCLFMYVIILIVALSVSFINDKDLNDNNMELISSSSSWV